MENATKALLIAGAVLIVMLLIAIGIGIINSTSGVRDEAGFQMSELEISIFNSQFTKYEGEQKGTKVKELLRLVIRSNARGDRGVISVCYWTGTGQPTGDYITSDQISSFINNIENNDKYPVNVEIDNNTGLVNKIIVTIHY